MLWCNFSSTIYNYYKLKDEAQFRIIINRREERMLNYSCQIKFRMTSIEIINIYNLYDHISNSHLTSLQKRSWYLISYLQSKLLNIIFQYTEVVFLKRAQYKLKV